MFICHKKDVVRAIKYSNNKEDIDKFLSEHRIFNCELLDNTNNAISIFDHSNNTTFNLYVNHYLVINQFNDVWTIPENVFKSEYYSVIQSK